ncbi:3-methylcrotonyl-CoA carboxylase subunit alpha [Purpureocillium lavendulum]|uniref:3-methylcrotonyl-CoA carboxylase subunit alpha n=1 Tax=Purpureocillium lavendulum TaxID=1247861 RepID=A0AB34FWM2_9HYPO|nr:3-methylcrotonyl-CoA carboxylase subunit alpha [Purpureocillium lavendulum]
MVRHYNFGVEIEAIGKPYGGGESFSNVDWYRQLAQKLQNRGIPAAHDDCSKYSKHPEYYGGKWFVTRDGSLKRPRPYVCMEVVSPRLDTTQPVSRTLSDFWEAMRVHFSPQRDASCGGHVHVTPVSARNRFSLPALKRVAFAALAYEDFVAAVLPAPRRDNAFCRLNSRSPDAGVVVARGAGGGGGGAGGGSSGCGEGALARGKSAAALRRVADEVRALPGEAELYLYMQGSRYVLWNFQNIVPHPKTGRCTGTVEFRGGNQFLNTRGTLAWVAFVLGFITLALKEDLLENFTTYVSPEEPNFPHRLAEWWVRLRRAAKKSRMSRHLPDDWTKMKYRPLPRYLSTTTTTASSPAASASASASSSSSSSAPVVTPLTSVLIANRGEIAIRINRTAERMGIRATTVYTDVDAGSWHASSGFQSLGLGPANGYLDGDKIIALAKRHGIQALHPGYGFLSENSQFAERCEREGIVFVGPPASAMADMGNKARSKEIMTAANVPCVPGYHGAEQAEEDLLRHARDVTFPVLLKSVRGGGGKGMRIVMTEDEFPAQLRSARAEARASFGEGGEVMLVEKYIVRPRHVEVQVFADRHGNTLALGERDCSVQRRHQKVLEESPAPDLDDVTRYDLWDKARKAASAVGYVGAGTVEFILDKDSGRFYFMEMNTRLQVEHPVTEMVTGLDLVEWQFRVAAGEPLPLTQDQVEERMRRSGAAIEARIYAENPEKGFMPDSGKLVHAVLPEAVQADEDVRLDWGFGSGSVVSEAYDGMIAKLIVRGDTRERAISKLESALRAFEIVGVSTNVEFLKRLCQADAFIAGDVETGFIDKWRDTLFKPRHINDEVFAQAALGVLGLQPKAVEAAPHGQTLGFGDASATAERKVAFKVLDGYSEKEGEVVEASVTQKGHNLYDVVVSRKGAAEPQVFSNVASEPTREGAVLKLQSYFPGERILSSVVPQEGENDTKVTIFQHGVKTDLALLPPRWYEKALGLKEVTASVVAPMPCKILKNEVEEGQEVKKGTPLVVIESMKMETVIRSPQDGIVKKLAHKEGDICKAGTVLVLFEEEPAKADDAPTTCEIKTPMLLRMDASRANAHDPTRVRATPPGAVRSRDNRRSLSSRIVATRLARLLPKIDSLADDNSHGILRLPEPTLDCARACVMSPQHPSLAGKTPWRPWQLARRANLKPNARITTLLQAERISGIAKVADRPDEDRTFDICDIYIASPADRATLEAQPRGRFRCPGLDIYDRNDACRPVRSWSHFHPMCYARRPCHQLTHIVSIPLDRACDANEVIHALAKMGREPHYMHFDEHEEDLYAS